MNIPILTSKKFQAAILAAILAFLGHYLEMDNAQILMIIGPLTAYIVGQGVADIGKEKAKVDREQQQ